MHQSFYKTKKLETIKKGLTYVGRVMGNLIFKPILKKMQPPISSAI